MGEAVGRGRISGCMFRTNDAGKSCDDSSQCESFCISPTQSFNDARCHEWTQFKGCGPIVVQNGKKQIICID